MGYNSDIENNSINREPRYETIQPFTKRKAEELENKSSRIPEDSMDEVSNKFMTMRIKQRVETVLDEGKSIESEDDFILYQQNNRCWKDGFKKGRIFEDLVEGELAENTQRLSGLIILEPNIQNKGRKNEFQDGYEKLFCFSNNLLSNTGNLFQKKEERTFRLTNEIQDENYMQRNILENEEEEYYLMLPMIAF
ncbi:hypothetical protein O181_018512 [Austropuccinia psidii MF-1]|uniref:Uncharacterized protein n=1 Tax=Austropuccinia psidii MF-1 TaxID=1389203 RepID=A0A9Q3GTK6_9BASI|nr:hypothetical protein [Austropuccinia psidii MF-1]